MVDTIFYFVDTYDEYREKLDTGLVSPLTIVFVLEQKAIYKGVNGNGEPVRFGNMTVEDIKQAINSIIGDTLAIENNKLDVDTNTLFSDPTVVEKINSVVSACLENPSQDFTNTLLEIINNCITSIDYPNLKGPKGDQGDLGIQGPKGDKGDDGYSITKIISTPTAEKTTITFQSKGVNLGSFDVHNGAKGEKGDRGPIGPLGERGPQGERGIQGPLGKPGTGIPFDDSEIWEKINLLDDTIKDEKDRLDERIDNLDSGIDETVQDLESDVKWIKEHGNFSNFGEDDVEQYLLILGVWSEDEVHDTAHAVWSKILQSVDGIELRVGNLETNGINTELLSSTINQKIANGEIQLNLENTYAKKTEIDGIEQIIEWIYSGLKSSASNDKSVTELVAAGKNEMLSAISDIRVLVNKLENGEYLATTDVTSKVKDSISGMLATADNTTAAGRFFSSVGDALSAGLITQTNLKDKVAIAGFMATDGDNSAAILNSINNGVSNIKIKADKIDLSGITTAEEVIIKRGNNLEAGMTNGNNETIENIYRDGVRIWAGTPRTIDDRTSLANCPFYVTNTGAMHAEGADVSGSITATDGSIGGFSIRENLLYNSNWDSGIDISTADGRRSVKIGKNAFGNFSTENAIIKAENIREDNQTYNTALYLNAQNAKYNYAFYGNGNGVLNGLMFGYKTQMIEVPRKGDDKLYKQISLQDGSTILFVGKCEFPNGGLGKGLVVMMPTLRDVKNCLGIPQDNNTPFAIELNFLNLSDDCPYLYLGFNPFPQRPYESDYPVNTGFDGGALESSTLLIAQNDYMKILLVYYNDKYNAYVTVHCM